MEEMSNLVLFTNYNNWVPLVFEVLTKINFGLKFYFPIFLIPSLKENRESC